MFIPIPPEIEDRRALVEAINDRLEEIDKPLTADRVLLAVPGERNDSRKTVMLDLQSTLFDLIGNTEKTISLDGDAIFGGDSWDEMTGGGDTTLHKHDIYGELAQDEVVTGDWTFTDTLDVSGSGAGVDSVLSVLASGAGSQATLLLKGTGNVAGYYSAVQLWSDEVADKYWSIFHERAIGLNGLYLGYFNGTSFGNKFIFSTGSDFGCGSITIAGATLDTNEWAYLDGQDQALKTTDLVQFDKIGINTATVPHGGVGHVSTGLALENRYIQMTAGDDYPQMQLINVAHDAVYIAFDAYAEGGTWKSSDASNFMLFKNSDQFVFAYDSGVTAGDTVTWNVSLTMNTDGDWLLWNTHKLYFDEGAAPGTEYIDAPGSSVLGLNAGGWVKSGTGSPAQAATAGSFYVTGKTEMAGSTFHSGGTNYFYVSGTQVDFWFHDNSALNTSNFIRADTSFDQFLWGLGSSFGRQIIFTETINRGHDHDHATQTNPTVFVHSATAAGTANDEWWSITHDVTNAVYTVGSGVHNFAGGHILIDGTGQVQLGTATTYAYQRAATYYSIVADGGIELQDQTSGNYTLVEPDGTLVCNGAATTWEDVYIGFAGAKEPPANIPTWATFSGNIKQYTFAVNDYLSLSASEVMHSYKEGSNVELHVHWVTNGLEEAEKAVKWEIEYTIANTNPVTGIGAAFPGTTTISAETAIPASTPDMTNMYTTIGTISDATLNFGAVLVVRVRRIAAVGDAPAADPFGIMLGAHIEQDTMGTRTVSTK